MSLSLDGTQTIFEQISGRKKNDYLDNLNKPVNPKQILQFTDVPCCNSFGRYSNLKGERYLLLFKDCTFQNPIFERFADAPFASFVCVYGYVCKISITTGTWWWLLLAKDQNLEEI